MAWSLTIESSPSAIEISVKIGSEVFWIVTPHTFTFSENTEVEATAPPVFGEPQESPPLFWRFKEWSGDIEDPPTNRKQVLTVEGVETITVTFEEQKYFPTRHPTKRRDKFEAKVDEDVYQARTTALKPMMVQQQEVTTAQQANMEKLVGTYLNNQGLYGTEIHHYRNFSQELWGLKRLFKDATLNAEASLKAEKWKARGLDPTHLTKIAKLLGITLTLAP